MLTPIGELLIEDELITQDQLDHCLEYKKMNPKDRLGAVLKHHGFINDGQLAFCLSKQIGWKFFKSDYIPDQKALERIGLDYFCQHQIFPLKNGGVPSFVVAFIDNVQATDFLKKHFGHEGVHFYIGTESEVRGALEGIVLEQNRQKLLVEIESLKSQGMDALVEWLDCIINLAIISRATDIHIEPTGKTTDVRLRIDGLLTSVSCLKPQVMSKLANIILTKCKGNPCDFGIQDGRFGHEFKQMARSVDVRFSQIPTIHGPAIVLRLLDRARAAIPLERLGYCAHNQRLINQAIRVPHGLILVTGPTGSGKSTTLSAVLNQIRTIAKKIITIEDPVEITHSLMQQVEVDETRQLTFEVAIRAFLRQDPDAILIGEIRDRKTAQESLRAANTGLQIFSTLHTHDPIAAILRLQDLGVETLNIASSLAAVIAQRLVRRLCPFCKTSFIWHPEEGGGEKYLSSEIQLLYKPQGCPQCRQGFLGRTVVAEVLLIDQEIKELIARNALGEIYTLLRQRGTYRTMADDMRGLLLKGETSLEEAIRVLG